MSAKIRISYETQEELQRLIDRIGSDIKNLKKSNNDQGRYKKAYIEMKEIGD